MWKRMTEWVGMRLRSRYVVMLEEDVARLRGENRALVNSLLGTAGFPPIALEDELGKRGGPAMTAVRRRTWSQIAREREFAAGKSAAGVAGAKSAQPQSANGKS